MRLIDADELLDDLIFPTKQFEKAFTEMINDCPTVEAEPIVRCKDCKYNYANMIPGGKGCQQMSILRFDDNFFCADGEREKDG